MKIIVERGSIGANVIKWQQIIGVKADGIFGPITEEETKNWQIARGFVDNGMVSDVMFDYHNGMLMREFLKGYLT